MARFRAIENLQVRDITSHKIIQIKAGDEIEIRRKDDALKEKLYMIPINGGVAEINESVKQHFFQYIKDRRKLGGKYK